MALVWGRWIPAGSGAPLRRGGPEADPLAGSTAAGFHAAPSGRQPRTVLMRAGAQA